MRNTGRQQNATYSNSEQKFEFPIIDRKESRTALSNFEDENNRFKQVEEAYILALENEFNKIQINKQNKKNDIINKTKIIQNAWRSYKSHKKEKAAIVIQKYFRFKIKEKLGIRQKYSNRLKSIIKIQRAVKKWIVLQNKEINEFAQKYKDRWSIYSSNELWEKETYWVGHTIVHSQIRSLLNEYKVKSFEDFSK